MIRSGNVTDEKICFGVLVLNENRVKYFLSQKKLRALALILPKSSDKYFKKILKKWEKEWSHINANNTLLNPALENLKSNLKDKWTAEKKGISMYADYYESEVEVEEHDFIKICNNFVGDVPNKNNVEKKKNLFKQKVREIQSQKYFDHYQKNVTLQPEALEGLLSNYKVDLLDVESQFSAIQFLDLKMSPLLLERKVLRFDSFVKTLQRMSQDSELPMGAFFIVYQNPRKDIEKVVARRLHQKPNISFEFVAMKDLKKKLKEKVQ